ncbi:ABC transporter permease [Nocardia carnea]|uniref:ABC transporter permease n=1 Tax=Nocardia carnea TaxID=37328 RepID=A0ABW7TJ76_9NOCA|nr:ABC transporter permease [Nocardia carnea]
MTASPTETESPPTQVELDKADQEELARTKKEKIGRIVGMFVFPFLMVGMMITGYLAAMHAPAPNNMPVAVAGPGAAEFATALEADQGAAVEVRITGSDAEARELVFGREVTGAVSLPAGPDGPATVYTAGAAGASQSSSIGQVLSAQVIADDLQPRTEDLAPLPAHDTAGLAVMFMTTALMLAGYMPLSLMLSSAPELLRFRRFVPLLAGWSALMAGLVWTVADPILGAVEGHTAEVLGISWLAVFAVGSVQLFLTRILGPMAVLVGMLFLMVLGVPASNLGMSVYTLPSLYPVLHGFLPAPATGEALRSILFFGGNGLAGHLAVLAAGAGIALLATLGIDALERRRNPNAAPPARTVESLLPGPRPRTRVHYALLAFFPLAMVGMMMTTMLGAMYQPAPKEMPVAVVAATPEMTDQVVQGLDQNMAGLFDLRGSIDSDEARELVRDRTVSAAYILPSAQTPHATLITNEAAGMSQQQVVQTVFGQVAAGQQMPMEIENITALADTDSMGTVSMYLAMGWIMAGFMIIIVGSTAAPMVMGLRTLLPLLAGWSLAMSAIVWLIAGPLVGAVHGHFLPLLGVGAVAIFSTALFTTIFVRLLGMLAVLPVIAVLMFLGVPASNGAMSIYMEPEMFRVLHEVLPMPAAVESVRSILYFDADTVGTHVATFAVWGVISLVVVMLIDRLRPRRADAALPVGTEN